MHRSMQSGSEQQRDGCDGGSRGVADGKRETVIGFLENTDAKIKKRSPSNLALLKESLKGNLSPSEATAQLKVLCRKFAALTEKVKEETKIREEAEKEVRRLKAIIDANAAPPVSSCRADTQAYLRELKQSQEKLKQELRFEKEKNAMLVSKALELEKEKSALLATHQAANTPDPEPSRQAKWDKEQVTKIQSTLRLTINELQDELTRKEEELLDYRERFQRERSRVKSLEQEIRMKDDSEHETKCLVNQLQEELARTQNQVSNEQQNTQEAQERVQEAQELRDTLLEQIETLNEVNTALEQRCHALVRRLELSSCVVQECQELKLQLHDAEIDNETLVRTIRDLKDQQFLREKDLKVQIEHVKDSKQQLETQMQDLESEIASLRSQNTMLSEWMLVRNENAVMSKREQEGSPRQKEISHRSSTSTSNLHKSRNAAAPSSGFVPPAINTAYQSPRVCPYPKAALSKSNGEMRPLAHSILSPSSPPKKQAMASSSWRDHAGSKSSAPSPAEAVSDSRMNRQERVYPSRSPQRSRDKMERKMSSTSLSSSCSSSSSSGSNVNADHERLRALMSRNRALQQRLHMETMATQDLEQEITDMTSSYRQT